MRLAQWEPLCYFGGCDTTEIPWRKYCAWVDHTRGSATRASLDAGRIAAGALRLPASLARPAVMRRRPEADRNLHVFVLLTLQRVPQCERLQRACARYARQHFSP